MNDPDPDPPRRHSPSVGEILERITVKVLSPDHSVSATFTPRGGITVTCLPDRLRDHTDSSLARQVEQALNKVFIGSRQAGEMAMTKTLGKRDPRPDDSLDTRIAAERIRRGRRQLADGDLEGISPLEEVRVAFHVNDGFVVDVRQGAVRGHDQQTVESEINAAVRAVLIAYQSRLTAVHDAVINRLTRAELEAQLS